VISFFIHSGGAGKIRGEQIAKRIGAKINPKEGFEKDICIYVKCVPPDNYPTKTYIDVVEESEGLKWVFSHPKVGVIASSVSMYNYLKVKLKNKIVLIPQHHCNFERIKRTRGEVKVAGIIGNPAAFQYPLKDIESKLRGIGVSLKPFIKKVFNNRQEVVDFYKQIDVQLIWRPGSDGVLRNPLKITNALSFGIPTVAYPEEDFDEEYYDLYVRTLTINEMIDRVERLKNSETYYTRLSKTGLEIAESYHIDNISKMYLFL
jgi:hypothetical protein